MGFGFFKWRFTDNAQGGGSKNRQRKFNGRKLAMLVKPGCSASRRIANRVIDDKQLFVLPVRGCKNRYCTCELVQFPSRRGGFDRRSGHDQRSAMRMTDERRTNSDRRKCGADVWKKNRYL